MSEILVVDPRFAILSDEHVLGTRSIFVEDHYRQVETIALTEYAPLEVKVAFDRARNAFVYAWYCYELLVVCELQACAALELALRIRTRGSPSDENMGLHHLFKQAIKEGAIPTADEYRLAELIEMRNKLAHGHLEIHTPKMALHLLSHCAKIIDQVFSPKAYRSSTR